MKRILTTATALAAVATTAQAGGVERSVQSVAILFEQGKPVWHASHDAITLASLHAAWAPRC